jgi:hypothetical protein
VSPLRFDELDRVAWKHVENLRRACLRKSG